MLKMKNGREKKKKTGYMIIVSHSLFKFHSKFNSIQFISDESSADGIVSRICFDL